MRRCVWSRNIKNRRSIYIYDISNLRVNQLRLARGYHVSEKPAGPTFRSHWHFRAECRSHLRGSQAVQNCLTVEDGTHRLPPKCWLPNTNLYHFVTSHKNEGLSYTVAKACNPIRHNVHFYLSFYNHTVILKLLIKYKWNTVLITVTSLPFKALSTFIPKSGASHVLSLTYINLLAPEFYI